MSGVTLAVAEMSRLVLGSPFSDHLVLQQNRACPIWGWDEPGQCIVVTIEGAKFAATSVVTTADGDGRFEVKCPVLKAGGPYRITVRGSSELLLNDVLVGEVWLASGQSNMEFTVVNCDGADAEIAAANVPSIRMFKVENRSSSIVEERCEGQWRVCSSTSVGDFSGVAYFFAREVHRQLGVPVGIINASFGGTYVEAWTSLEGLRPVVPDLARELAEMLRQEPKIEEIRDEYLERVRGWERLSLPSDPGNLGMLDGWANTDFDDSEWKTMELPRFWQSVGMNFNGVVWFRKTVEVPKSWAGKELTLSLGAIDDFDQTYLNGVLIGEHPDGTPEAYQIKRRYIIPGALVRPGRNVIAVRVFDHCGQGGFVGPHADMTISKTDGPSKVLSVAGIWKYAVELEIPLVSMNVFQTFPPPPKVLAAQHAPAALFQGMIAPLIPYQLAGFLFYQGESNVEDYANYRDRMVALIRDWRTRFGQGTLPFAFVQLAGFLSNPAWPHLREAQFESSVEPNCFLATAFDVGDKDDIHPRNKKTVGLRLAYLALANHYGKTDIGCFGPIFQRFEIENSAVRVYFRHSNHLHCSDGTQSVKGFQLAGKDGVYHQATATIELEAVVVKSPMVRTPYAVRYAFKDYCEVNLVNGDKLPALPFRTDGASPI
jgi:sialate O-acetylesterase